MATYIKLLVLALCAIFVYGTDVSYNIDCGSSEVYGDDDLKIWEGDNLVIQNGENHVVQDSSSSHVLDTLRAFTTRKKNCYTFAADNNTQVLVRASFYYGNYDRLSSPPTFDLQFNGNHWDSVVTSINETVIYESIYVLQMDDVSICLAQTEENQIPFISALEITSLPMTMYHNVSAEYALFLRNRIAYGADASRSIGDTYGRIWIPAAAGSGLIEATSDAIFIDTESAPDQPPQAVLQNAITASDPSTSIRLLFNSIGRPLYINLYFSEVAQLDAADSRIFQILVNNESFSDPIVPIYSGVTEFIVPNFTITSTTTISLSPTRNSTLPPLINAMEVFYISDVMTNGTHTDDVDGLSALTSSFDVLSDSSGDPCLPSSFTWDWLECSTGATPRVTALYLNSSGLSGSLPDFSSMDALETIYLQDNSISGPIPEFLGAFPNLRELNLADNQFSGPIPASLSRNTNLRLVATGNPDLCTSGRSCDTTNTPVSPSGNNFPTSPSSGRNRKKKNNLPVILGSTIPAFFVFWAIVGAITILRHKRKSALVAATTSGQHNGGNGSAANTQGMASKIGEAMMNEFKDDVENNIQEQSDTHHDDTASQK